MGKAIIKTMHIQYSNTCTELRLHTHALYTIYYANGGVQVE